MATEPGQAPKPEGEETRLRIYLLPNLLTAGNLFCGFLALTKIVEADISDASFPSVIRHAIFFIILACVFDLDSDRRAKMRCLWRRSRARPRNRKAKRPG